jgi:hypothetical protein
MNNNLLFIVRRIIADNGEGILGDPARLKALFSDLAKDEPKPLRIAFGRGLEAGSYMALKTAPEAAERISRKAAIAQRVRDEHGLDMILCAEALDILESALYGTASAAGNTPHFKSQPAPVQAPPVQWYQQAQQQQPVYQMPPAQPYQQPGQQQSLWQKGMSVPGGKSRHTVTTFWLVSWIVLSGLLWIYCLYLASITGNILDILLSGMVPVGLFLLLRWKKVGFWILVFAVAGLIVGGLMSAVYDDAVMVLSVFAKIALVGSTYGILRLRGANGKSAWEQLDRMLP